MINYIPYESEYVKEYEKSDSVCQVCGLAVFTMGISLFWGCQTAAALQVIEKDQIPLYFPKSEAPLAHRLVRELFPHHRVPETKGLPVTKTAAHHFG